MITVMQTKKIIVFHEMSSIFLQVSLVSLSRVIYGQEEVLFICNSSKEVRSSF